MSTLVQILVLLVKLTIWSCKVLWPIVYFTLDVIMTAFLIVLIRSIAHLNKSTIVVFPRKRNKRSIW